MTAARRIQMELTNIIKNPDPAYSIGPKSDDNLMLWEGKINGPAGTPYEKGVFPILLEFTNDFPFKPPKLRFCTKVYHPNIDEEGNICIALLKSDVWKPSTKIIEVLATVAHLLSEPNPDDPLDANIAEQFRTDYKTFEKTAKEWTKKYSSK